MDLEVAVADGARTISEIDVLCDQAELFGSVASDSTCWRLLDSLDDTALAQVVAARARAREVVWDQDAERYGRAFPPARVAGHDLDVLVIDLDASIVVCHSEREQAAATFKRTFDYRPLMAFCDNTSEFLVGVACRGNAGAITAADHVDVFDQALAQIPDQHRHGRPALVRADTAGCTKAFLTHIRSRRGRTVCEFSVG
ncbi:MULTISPECIES: transposase [unclassified Pseudonocardia]|uniref:transposase n=1 Tax=unclassified Pseudonocardia TaxID=2619320 RepID=UPI00076111B1|nr:MULTISPECIES: transposase [unclassified Pseudonocardia]